MRWLAIGPLSSWEAPMSEKDEGVVVTQADREAAAELLGGAAPDGLLEGRQDSLSLVRAFARHRLRRTPPPSPAGGEPVAWMYSFLDDRGDTISHVRVNRDRPAPGWTETPLYTHPTPVSEAPSLGVNSVEAKYKPAEIKFLQCLLGRYSEGGGIIDLGNDHQAFMSIVRKHAVALASLPTTDPAKPVEALGAPVSEERVEAVAEKITDAVADAIGRSGRYPRSVHQTRE
jgi:hypothetical protein